jgi:F0F1-type ATP synthase epsilon subunit
MHDEPGSDTAVKEPTAGGKPIMHIKIYSPFKTYFDQDGYSITGVNNTGPFDILPHHHNFMTLLDASELLIRTPVGEQRIRIARGIMHVKSDQVIVFLDV